MYLTFNTAAIADGTLLILFSHLVHLTQLYHQVKLSREEGLVEALEQQLGTLDNTREQLEKKLQNVYASLRAVTRMYQDISPASPSLRSRKGTKIGWYRAAAL
ncbi:hypothetical protein E2C01_098664 [Portunus trituberculatus]|uniref:Uncharacterized protein n=1 Tax=Portunus trituberculatus TaxID=210409 RepID=A0A5B7K8Z2_PORTR|nr:hypothetical protein [Portunus trituberculatus]